MDQLWNHVDVLIWEVSTGSRKNCYGPADLPYALEPEIPVSLVRTLAQLKDSGTLDLRGVVLSVRK
jgi:hypothetical protein